MNTLTHELNYFETARNIDSMTETNAPRGPYPKTLFYAETRELSLTREETLELIAALMMNPTPTIEGITERLSELYRTFAL